MKKQLTAIAGRLRQLAPSTPEQSTPFNFAVGAVYALSRALELNYSDVHELGRGMRMWQEAKDLCHLIECGSPPKEGEWLAGYFFNDAIMRIAVAYEHLIREATEANDDGGIDFEKVKQLGFRQEWLDSREPLRIEMNRLKHRTHEFVDGPPLMVEQTVQALEYLVNALDRKNWTSSPLA
jgi:hypothetical protein